MRGKGLRPDPVVEREQLAGSRAFASIHSSQSLLREVPKLQHL